MKTILALDPGSNKLGELSRKLSVDDLYNLLLAMSLFPPAKEGEEYIEVDLGWFEANLTGDPKMVVVGKK